MADRVRSHKDIPVLPPAPLPLGAIPAFARHWVALDAVSLNWVGVLVPPGNCVVYTNGFSRIQALNARPGKAIGAATREGVS
jgi:hypothetical protein